MKRLIFFLLFGLFLISSKPVSGEVLPIPTMKLNSMIQIPTKENVLYLTSTVRAGTPS